MKQKFLYFEFDLNRKIADYEINDEINEQVDKLCKNYKIIDFKMNYISLKDRYSDNNYIATDNGYVLGILCLVEYEDNKGE